MTILISIYLCIGALIVAAVAIDDVRTGWLALSEASSLKFWATIGVYVTMVFAWPVAVVMAVTKGGRK